MADFDLVACLYPFEDSKGIAETTIHATANNSRFVGALLPEPELKIQYGRGDRESTEPPEQPQGSHLDYCPRLEWRFS